MVTSAKEKELRERAKRFLKGKLKHAGVTYEQLAELLKKQGIEETVPSIASKLSRGTFSATFFLGAMTALGLEGFQMKDL